MRGVCELALKFRCNWKGPLGKKNLSVKIANRTREIRPSGMKEGAYGNVGYGGIRNSLHNRKGACWKLSAYGCARRNSILTTPGQPYDNERGRPLSMLIRRATGRYKGTKFYWVGKGVGVAHSTVWISGTAKPWEREGAILSSCF